MRFRALGAASAVSAITAGVVVAGRGTLVSPPIRHPASLPHWWQSVGPLMGVFSMLRLAVIASGAYCVLLLGLVSAADLVAGEQGPRLVARTHLLGVRRALTLALGASAAGALVAGCASAGSRAPLVPRPVLTYVSPVSPATGPSSLGAGGLSAGGPKPRVSAGPLTRQRHSVVARPKSSSGARARPAKPSLGVASPSHAEAVWSVRPGDNLWSIASTTLERRLGRAASDQEVDTYWQAVIEVNRQRLPVPSDPSLLFAGDLIELPPSAAT